MRKHAIVLLMALVIVIQGVLVTGIVQPKAGSLTQNVPQHENVYQSAGLPGEKPLLANVLPNPGFEQVDSYGGPLQWNYYGSAYTGSNASYTGLTYGGSYSGLLEAMGTQQWGTDAYMYRYLTSAPFAMLSQRIILNLFWDVRQNPDIARWAYAYIRLEMYNGSTGSTSTMRSLSAITSVPTARTPHGYALTTPLMLGIN